MTLDKVLIVFVIVQQLFFFFIKQSKSNQLITLKEQLTFASPMTILVNTQHSNVTATYSEAYQFTTVSMIIAIVLCCACNMPK